MAAMPSNQGSSAIGRRARLDGAVEVVGDGQDLADQVLAGEPELAHALLARPSLEVLELGALALERRQVLVGRLRASSRSPVSVSICATRAVGEMSISSARSWARVRRRSGIEVIHQFVHETGHEADRADRLGVGHPGRPEDADDADRPARAPVRREDERDVAHLERLVLVADEDLDPPGARDAADELAEVGPVLEGGEDAPELVALGELRAPP